MKKIMVDKENKKVIEFLESKFHSLRRGTIYKALRNKDIRVNGIKINDNTTLHIGDELTVYIPDNILQRQKEISSSQIIYNDENIVIVNKPQDMLVVSQENESGLDKLVSDYLDMNVFPCHRIDRNTMGLVIFAKSHEVEKLMLEAIKNHALKKIYRCTVWGHPTPQKCTLVSYLFKDRKKSNVIISNQKLPGYSEIITKYQVIKYLSDNTTELEVELVTRKNSPNSSTFSTYWASYHWRRKISGLTK